MAIFYADASALVKLIREEPESEALRAFLADGDIVTSELVLTEIRARFAARPPMTPSFLATCLSNARASCSTRSRCGRSIAPCLPPPERSPSRPRALDAIHVASAVALDPIDAFLTYDERQAAAVRLAGLRTVAPGT